MLIGEFPCILKKERVMRKRGCMCSAGGGVASECIASLSES